MISTSGIAVGMTFMRWPASRAVVNASVALV
jgi:hypothetical protein